MTKDHEQLPNDSELKIALVFFALAAVAFGVMYFIGDGSISQGGIAAASILAVGISRAMAARARKAQTGAAERGR